MAVILKGREVAESLLLEMSGKINQLKEKNVIPTMAIVRVGENPDDIAYESSITKKATAWGSHVRSWTLKDKATEEEMINLIDSLNEDNEINGVLIFQPFPATINEELIRNKLYPEKDLDGFTTESMQRIYAGKGLGYAPCTAEAVLEILKYYKIPMTGKKALVLGRSLVIGKPVAMMLLSENATITIVHSRTERLKEELSQADIIIASAGAPSIVDKDCVKANQVVIDVGININEEGQLVGDVDFTQVEKIVGAITPVPGGVGAVTTAVLFKHLVDRTWNKQVF